ncbi:unnamed protein product [Cylicocyclus nassatus]|uniref:Uncharacterized protein n=1 Tax=Cylicocyclus nassatus TaxID=53992 RepID=A0AA36MHL9_CYLNA|nr:unnamed protein product [Cylicocyclus nassatus]
MKVLAALIVLLACATYFVSAAAVREKRQYGPYPGRGPYPYYPRYPRPYGTPTTSSTMKLLAALLVIIACLASFISAKPVREKRQWGPPPFRGPYGRPFGPRGFGGPPTVIQKTTVFRG